MLETKTVTNGPLARQLQRACHRPRPWLISFSLGVKRAITRYLRGSPAWFSVAYLPALFVCGHYPQDFDEPPIKPIKIPHVSPISSAVYSPQPRYPYEARFNCWEATLSVELLVRPDGTVRRAIVVQTSGHPLLDRCAVEAFRQWRFKPGMADHLQIHRHRWLLPRSSAE